MPWGLMLKITPFMIAAYGSLSPKSVVKVIIGEIFDWLFKIETINL